MIARREKMAALEFNRTTIVENKKTKDILMFFLFGLEMESATRTLVMVVKYPARGAGFKKLPVISKELFKDGNKWTF